MSKFTGVACAALGLATVSVLLPPPARADSVRSTSCVGSYRSVSCVTIRRSGIANPHITHVPTPMSEQLNAEAERRDKAWHARCRPVVRQDRHGVPRYVYAARGCEFGTLD